MAFKLFKKKELEFPAEEKAEVLEEKPEIEPELKPSFEQGFRSPEELRPPQIPQLPQPKVPPSVPTSLPPFERPEPIPLPKPAPKPIELPKSEFGEPPKVREVPHIYIKISKYKEVMNTIKELSQQIAQTKNDLDELNNISEQERGKIKEAAEVLLKIEKLLSYLEETFTSPEE
ncbi:MAG: hypothetical protein J7K22_02305 [Nanoarchaeota archaeon]|nr:hypothetical protein [Nanoarchaeota archaeon]